MKIFVKAKAGAREEKIVPPAQKLWAENENRESGEKEWYKVSVKEPPMQGKANEAIGRALAGYFKVAPSQVRLISGSSSKQKVFEILM
jgi:uncharacterized protein